MAKIRMEQENVKYDVNISPNIIWDENGRFVAVKKSRWIIRHYVLVLLGRHVASGITAPSPSRCSLHHPSIICSIIFSLQTDSATGLTSVNIVKFK
jgi:hypothetical protein